MSDRTEPRDPLDLIDLIDLPEPSPPIRESDWLTPETVAHAQEAIARFARTYLAANDGDSPKAEQT